MPELALVSLLMPFFWTLPARSAEPPQQRSIELEFDAPYGRSTYEFTISEGAHIAVFELGERKVELVYPDIGRDLRRLLYGEADALPAPADWFEEGRHLLPPRAGRPWFGVTETGFLMKGRHVLVVASKRPFHFARLNSLYANRDGALVPRLNSLGAVDDFTNELLKTILPDYGADDWNAYLHWIRW